MRTSASFCGGDASSEDKGQVESAVKYAKNNGLKGHTFGSLAEQNAHLLSWEETVADTRIHGTTKKQVRRQFETVERPALLPLPRDRFAMFHEVRRTVSRDGHLEVDNAFPCPRREGNLLGTAIPRGRLLNIARTKKLSAAGVHHAAGVGAVGRTGGAGLQ